MLGVIENKVAVEEPTANAGPEMPFGLTESKPQGEEVPIPTFLDESTTNPVPPTVRREEKRLVELAVVEKKLVEVALVVVELPLAMKSPF